MDNNFGVVDRPKNVLEDSDSDSEKEDVEYLESREDRKVMGEEDDQFLSEQRPRRIKDNWEDEDDESEENEEELTNQSFNQSKMESESVVSETKLEPFDFNNLPPEACNYCGIHDVKCVVQCKSKGCNKWFCNGKGTGDYGSHILWHMVKANHKELQVHPNSELKDSPLECYQCGSKNMFLLGFISAKTEWCIILLCREPCLSKMQS